MVIDVVVIDDSVAPTVDTVAYCVGISVGGGEFVTVIDSETIFTLIFGSQ